MSRHSLTGIGSMKKLFAAVAAAALSMSATSVFAEDATGTIGAVDPDSNTIILDDGRTYTFAEGMSVEGFQPGDIVTISFESDGDKNTVIQVTMSQ